MKNKFEKFKNDSYPAKYVEALKTGRPIIRQVFVQNTKVDGSVSSNPYRVQLQQLKEREVDVSSEGTPLGVILSGSSINLNIVNVTTIENLTEEAAKKYFGDTPENYDAMDASEILTADIFLTHSDINSLDIVVKETFEPSYPSQEPKRRGAEGEIVTAIFNGEETEVYRQTNLAANLNSDPSFYINPRASYVGKADRPVEITAVDAQAAVDASKQKALDMVSQ